MAFIIITRIRYKVMASYSSSYGNENNSKLSIYGSKIEHEEKVVYGGGF